MPSVQELRKSLAPYAPYPLHDLLSRAAGRHGRRVAVIDGDRGFTYGQLSDYSNRFASALAKLGVRNGDRIAILAHADRTWSAAGHSSTMLEWTMLETRSSLTLCHGSGAMQLVR